MSTRLHSRLRLGFTALVMLAELAHLAREHFDGGVVSHNLLTAATGAAPVLLRVYRAECLLGFVLGMAFTFGAVLPTLIGAVVAVVSAVVHLGIRPIIARLQHPFGRPDSATA